MIRTLSDDTTRDIWNGVNSKAGRRIPRELWPIVRRKLDQIDAVTRLDDLKVPQGIGCTRSAATFEVSMLYASTTNAGSSFGSKGQTRSTCSAPTITEELQCCRPIAPRRILARCS